MFVFQPYLKKIINQEENEMMRIIRKLNVVWVVFFTTALILFACGSGGGGGGGNSEGGHEGNSQKASVEIEANLANEGLQSNSVALAAVSLSRVEIKVYNGTSVIGSLELQKIDGYWKGSLTDLPVSTELIFSGKAYDSTGGEVYAGTTNKVLVSGPNTVSIAMNPLVGNHPEFTKVISLTSLNGGVFPSEAKKILLQIEDSNSSKVFYEFSSTGGVFTPGTGQITVTGGKGNLELAYTAPGTVNTYSGTVCLTNSLGNKTKMSFGIKVVKNPDDVIVVVFAPAITEIKMEKVENGLKFYATVFDDGPESALSYSWSFSGNLSFTASTVNQAVLQGYSDGDAGIVTLSVSDAGGQSSSITIDISGQDFSNLVTITYGLPSANRDLIIDGTKTAVGGIYRNIVVKNAGSGTITGNVFSETITVINGKLVVNGNLFAGSLAIEENNLGARNEMVVYGNNNSVNTMEVKKTSRFQLMGRWKLGSLIVREGAEVFIEPYSSARESSGGITIETDSLLIEGVINANGTGADPRGKGGGWYRNSGGGAYGGNGCRGYWDASSPGVAFEDAYSYVISMGGEGGYYGGGKIQIKAKDVVVKGSILSNGRGENDGVGGGAGGGILIHCETCQISGTLQAKGGKGGNGYNDGGGGGGGGRIKIYYDSGTTLASIIGLTSVTGGQRGGYLNTCDGGPGTVYTDAVPKIPNLIAPVAEQKFSVSEKIVFTFSINDESVTTDNRNEDLGGIVELSKDNFATVYATYNQNASIAGWSKLSYKSGDTAEFVLSGLPAGAYQWRVSVRDRSITGKASSARQFTVQ